MKQQNRQNQLHKEYQSGTATGRHYYAEVRAHTHKAQTASIERLIDMAFGKLGVQHLELRVIESEVCYTKECSV